jgi:hypothetical protein
MIGATVLLAMALLAAPPVANASQPMPLGDFVKLPDAAQLGYLMGVLDGHSNGVITANLDIPDGSRKRQLITCGQVRFGSLLHQVKARISEMRLAEQQDAIALPLVITDAMFDLGCRYYSPHEVGSEPTRKPGA